MKWPNQNITDYNNMIILLHNVYNAPAPYFCLRLPIFFSTHSGQIFKLKLLLEI